MLSVIIPVRCTVQAPYVFERLEALVRAWDATDETLELFIADSGSHEQYRARIEDLCAGRFNVTYGHHDSHGEIFSIGAVRDFAAQRARMPFVMFQDVDLVLKDGMYARIIEEIRSRRMDVVANDFFLLPCMYLTEEGSRAFLQRPDFAALERAYFAGDDRLVHAFAPSTSTWVLNRHYYLSLGGHRREFYGHGCEDFEFLHRLCSNLGQLARPRNYYVDRKDYKSLEYAGFRAWFAAHGLPMFYRGFYSAHIWHPRQVMTGYDAQRTRNQALLGEFMRGFDAARNYPEALTDLASSHKTLFVGVEGDRSWECVRQAMPLLGEVIYRRTSEITMNETAARPSPALAAEGSASADAGSGSAAQSSRASTGAEPADAAAPDFSAFMRAQGVTRLFMFNPYGNEQRLALYRWARETGFPFVVFERGGLPDSWFFDSRGFNADSGSYAPALWDAPLTPEQDARTTAYIDELLSSGRTLEHNGERCGADVLRRKLRISRDAKVLFVPFQRPRDTVIRYFSGSVQGVDEFAAHVQAVAQRARSAGWVVVAKKHPLEAVVADMPDVVMLPEDTHVYDALALCDATLLINSGVGLLAAIFRKPVLHFGEIYYGHPGLNRRVRSTEDVLGALASPPVVEFVNVKRLVRYLREDFYSFGQALTEQRQHADGSRDTITLAVSFEQINLMGERHSYALADRTVPWNAPAYANYLLDIHQQRRTKPVTGAAAAAHGSIATAQGVQPVAVRNLQGSSPFHLRRPLDKPLRRKLRKLLRDPRQFFADSAAGRMLGRVFG